MRAALGLPCMQPAQPCLQPNWRRRHAESADVAHNEPTEVYNTHLQGNRTAWRHSATIQRASSFLTITPPRLWGFHTASLELELAKSVFASLSLPSLFFRNKKRIPKPRELQVTWRMIAALVAAAAVIKLVGMSVMLSASLSPCDQTCGRDRVNDPPSPRTLYKW